MNRKWKLFLAVALVALMTMSCVLLPESLFSSSAGSAVSENTSEEAVQTTVEKIESVEETGALESELPVLYEQVNPGVVSIRTLTEEGEGLGTGFVWDTEGHVVTNFHVVRSAEDVEVDFPSGFKTRAEVIGTDADSDLAVLELAKLPENIVVLDKGVSSELRVGESVVAIGNPRGLSSTMTVGIVSALGRTMDSMNQAPGGGAFATGNIIQTDAAINPGNSGGPLLNMAGQVVGINSAIQTNSIDLTGQPVNSGLGFAISIDMAKNVVPDLIESGSHASPYVGIRVLDEVTLFVKEELNLARSSGVYVLEVTEGSPADEAGLRGAFSENESGPEAELPTGGDLIVGIDDQPVNDFSDFMGYLLTYNNPGDDVQLTVVRGDEELTLTLTLEERP